MATPRHQLTGRSDWTLMTAIHDALRRDLDELVHTTASRTAAQAHGAAFRDQLDFHLAAEDSACWPPARARLTGDPHGQALLDAMEGDEQQLIGPLRAVTDDAFTMDALPRRLRQLLARLRTRLTSSLAHEEAGALPLITRIIVPSAWSKNSSIWSGPGRAEFRALTTGRSIPRRWRPCMPDTTASWPRANGPCWTPPWAWPTGHPRSGAAREAAPATRLLPLTAVSWLLQVHGR